MTYAKREEIQAVIDDCLALIESYILIHNVILSGPILSFSFRQEYLSISINKWEEHLLNKLDKALEDRNQYWKDFIFAAHISALESIQEDLIKDVDLRIEQ